MLLEWGRSNLRTRPIAATQNTEQERSRHARPSFPALGLVAVLAGRHTREAFVIRTSRRWERERLARPRDMERAWRRAEVRSEVWTGRPHHAYRKGFISGLRRAGADPDAVEFLVGHSLGLKGVYTDPDALALREAVAKVPPLNLGAEIVRLADRRNG